MKNTKTAKEFNSGHDLLRAEALDSRRDLMRALNAVFGFDFQAPYHVERVEGHFTVNKIKKTVEAAAPLYAVKPHAFRVVALVKQSPAVYGYESLSAVEITPRGFDIEPARGISHTFFDSSDSFSYFFTKRDFDDLRKSDGSYCLVVVQAAEHLRTIQKRSWRRTDLIREGERYDLEKVNTFVYEHGGAQFIRGVDIRTRTASGELISYELPICHRDRAIPAKNIGAVIDKSGYLLIERRADLKRRADAMRAEKKRKAYMETDNREKVEALRAIIAAKREALSRELREAKTAAEVETIYKQIRDYSNSLARFEVFEARTASKEYPSIEAAEEAYNGVLWALNTRIIAIGGSRL